VEKPRDNENKNENERERESVKLIMEIEKLFNKLIFKHKKLTSEEQKQHSNSDGISMSVLIRLDTFGPSLS
jgi:hypothetical protein